MRGATRPTLRGVKDQPTPPQKPFAKTMAEAMFGREPKAAMVKRVTADVCGAVIQVVVTCAIGVAAVLLLIKLAMWVFG